MANVVVNSNVSEPGNFSLPMLIEVRSKLCASCDEFIPSSPEFPGRGKCKYLIEHTGKAGRLDHPNGIRNVRSRCPKQRYAESSVNGNSTKRKYRIWQSITSYHPWYIETHHMRLDPDQRHYFTKYGIAWIKPLGVANLICDYRKREGLSVIKRSILLNEYVQVAKTLNGYQHLTVVGVNYRTGETDTVSSFASNE